MRRTSDDKHIDVTDPAEVSYWASQLGVRDEQVHEAVKAVGNTLDAVIKHLGKSDPRNMAPG
jgi:hypothetical protein